MLLLSITWRRPMITWGNRAQWWLSQQELNARSVCLQTPLSPDIHGICWHHLQFCSMKGWRPNGECPVWSCLILQWMVCHMQFTFCFSHPFLETSSKLYQYISYLHGHLLVPYHTVLVSATTECQPGLQFRALWFTYGIHCHESLSNHSLVIPGTTLSS